MFRNPNSKHLSFIQMLLFVILLLRTLSSATESIQQLQDNSTNEWEAKVSKIDTNSIANFMYIDTVDIYKRSSSAISESKVNEYINVLKTLKNDRIDLYYYYLNRKRIKANRALKKYAEGSKIVEFEKFKETPEAKSIYKAILNLLVIEEYLKTPEHKRKKIEEYIAAESFFIKNKKNLDAVRSKYVLTPHEENYFLIHSINDSVAADSSFYGSRPAINWRVSVKFPILAARERESGIFLFFTNTGCFDFTNDKESQPVCKKSLIPGAFYRFDFEIFPRFGQGLKHIGIDNEIDIGAYHHSNGGYSTNDRSRGVNVLPFIKNTFRIGKHHYDSTLYNAYSEHYMFTLNLKVHGYIDYKDNPDIPDHWGYVLGQLTFEKALDIKPNNGTQLLFWADVSLSKASQSLSISFMPVINKFRKQSRIRLPLAWYMKLYHGKDEYLLNYRNNEKWIGAGLMFRK